MSVSVSFSVACIPGVSCMIAGVVDVLIDSVMAWCRHDCTWVTGDSLKFTVDKGVEPLSALLHVAVPTHGRVWNSTAVL